MIVCNGCPKSGTHSLLSLVSLTNSTRVKGLLEGREGHGKLRIRPTSADPRTSTIEDALNLPHSYYVHAHVSAVWAPMLKKAKVITIIRHPKNTITSALRARSKPLNSDSLLKAMQSYYGHPFVETYRSFLGWRGNSVIVRFEDIPIDFASSENVYCDSIKDNSTFSGAHSDWRSWWNQSCEEVWRKFGGHKLLKEAGYEGCSLS